MHFALFQFLVAQNANLPTPTVSSEMLSIFQCLFLLKVMQGFLKLPGCSCWRTFQDVVNCLFPRETSSQEAQALFLEVLHFPRCNTSVREKRMFLHTGFSGTQVSTKSNCLGGTFSKLDSEMRTDPIIPKPFRKCYLTHLSSGTHCWDVQIVLKCQLTHSADYHGNISTLHHQCFQLSGSLRPLGVVILNYC